MYSDVTDFNAFVEQKSLEELKGWLLTSFESSDFSPFRLLIEPSATVQLEYGFAKLEPPQLKEHFKAATIRATAEWSFPAYSPNTLKQLVLLAAYIRAAGIIGVLRVLVNSGALEGLKSIEEDTETIDAYTATVQYVVGVLQGFAPLPEVKEVLEKLFIDSDDPIDFDDPIDSDDRFDPRFAAQLFMGLCECTPTEYWKYLPRFLSLRERHPRYYVMPYVMHELVRIVSLGTIEKYFDKLDPRTKIRFLNSLLLREPSPVKFEIGTEPKNDELVESYFLISSTSKPRQRYTLYVGDLWHMMSQEELQAYTVRVRDVVRPSELHQNPETHSVSSFNSILGTG